ncbi:MAG: AAA family ATPase [Bacteroidota bacterium]|nr:AAA family ATPase [Bacteroidota bacterium]
MEQYVLSNKSPHFILKPFYKSFQSNDNYQMEQGIETPIKRYYFQPKLVKNYSDSFSLFLKTSGENLYSIIEGDAHLREIAGDFFKEYKLDFVFDIDKKKFLIQKRIGNIVYNWTLTMTPDTFQRLIYYLAAIYSNNNSVLLFEEPEAHSFPPYISMIGELIGKKAENQYFISTHSPYVYQSIVSNTNKDDLAVWALSYSKGQTKMVQLTEKQIGETLSDGVDVFQNIERYTK